MLRAYGLEYELKCPENTTTRKNGVDVGIPEGMRSQASCQWTGLYVGGAAYTVSIDSETPRLDHTSWVDRHHLEVTVWRSPHTVQESKH